MTVLTPKEFPTFSIIHQHGMPMEATTLDGIKVFRKEKIFIPEYGYEVRCAPYDDHFIYEEPTGKRGRPAYLCSCGAMAVIIDPKTNRKNSSIQEKMFVCHSHLMLGAHNTSLDYTNYGKRR